MKFPALAVLLMVNVLPVIPVAELSRPTLAAPLMLSELPDTAPVDVSVAPATAPVAVSAAQETAPEASTPVVNTSVQFTSLHSSWSQPTLPPGGTEKSRRAVLQTPQSHWSHAQAARCYALYAGARAVIRQRGGLVAKQGDPPALPEVDILHAARIVATCAHEFLPTPWNRSSVAYQAHWAT